MQNSAAIPPGKAAGRPGTPKHPRAFPPAPLPRMAWTGAANIALAVLVVIAGFGAWRAFDGGFGGGGNGTTPSKSNYAFAPTTPVPMGTPETAEEVAPIPACDYSGNIPIFTAVEHTEYKGTALYLWKDQSPDQWATGDLVLRCAGEDDVVLASDVYSASPGPMSGIVALHQYPDPATTPEESVTTYLDVVSGRSVSFGDRSDPLPMRLANGGTDFVRSEWVLGVSLDDPSVLEIANLQTMEKREFSEFSDVIPSDRSAPWSVESGDTMVVGFRFPYSVESTDGGAVVTGPASPGDILVLNGDFANTHWISIPDELSSIKEAWLSPNGDYLAVATYSGESMMEEQRSYAIVSTADGHVVSQSEESPRWDNASVSWVQDSSAIVFAEQHTLRMLRAEDGASADTLLETEGELYAPRTTYDASTVVIQEYPSQDEAGHDNAGVYAAHIVDTSTGETTSIEGRDINGMIAWIPMVNTLAMVIPDASEPETTTVSFYDAVTGEHIEEVDGVPYPYSTSPSGPPLIGKASIATTPDASATLLTIGSQFMFLTEAIDGESQVRQLPAFPEPYSDYNSTLTVDIADDGSMGSTIRMNDEANTRFVLDLTDPAAEWIEIPTEEASHGVHVSFVATP